MIQSQIKSIGVLGGGISGLSSAYYLNKKFPDAQIKIYEKQSHLGGAMQSKIIDNQIYDLGPRSLRNAANIVQILKICEEAENLDQILPSQNFDQVFLYYDKKMRSVPRAMNFKTIKNFILDNPKLITSAFQNIQFKSGSKTAPGEDKTIQDFIQQTIKLGPLQPKGLQDFLTHYFANAVFNGIFRADPEQLSFNLCLKKQHIKNYYNKNLPKEQQEVLSKDVVEFQKNFKASSFSFKQGISQLPQTIIKLLKKNNNFEEFTNSEINSIIYDKENQKTNIEFTNSETGAQSTNSHDIVVSTINANILGDILQNQQQNQEIVNILQSIKHLSMRTLNLGFDQEVVFDKFKSFGALVPRNQNYEGLGLILNSTIFPAYSPEGQSNISLFLSEHVTEDQVKNNLQSIIKKCLREMLQQYGEIEPTHIEQQYWQNFFPVYEVNHYNKIMKLFQESQKQNPNLYLHGNYLFTGAVPDLMQQSEVISNVIYQKSLNK